MAGSDRLELVTGVTFNPVQIPEMKDPFKEELFNKGRALTKDISDEKTQLNLFMQKNGGKVVWALWVKSPKWISIREKKHLLYKKYPSRQYPYGGDKYSTIRDFDCAESYLSDIGGLLRTRSLVLSMLEKHQDLYYEGIYQWETRGDSFYICFLTDNPDIKGVLRYVEDEGLNWEEDTIKGTPRYASPVIIEREIKRLYKQFFRPIKLKCTDEVWSHFVWSLTEEERKYLISRDFIYKPCYRYSIKRDKGKLIMSVLEGYYCKTSGYPNKEYIDYSKEFLFETAYGRTSSFDNFGEYKKGYIYLQRRCDSKVRQIFINANHTKYTTEELEQELKTVEVQLLKEGRD